MNEITYRQWFSKLCGNLISWVYNGYKFPEEFLDFSIHGKTEEQQKLWDNYWKDKFN